MVQHNFGGGGEESDTLCWGGMIKNKQQWIKKHYISVNCTNSVRYIVSLIKMHHDHEFVYQYLQNIYKVKYNSTSYQ